MIKIIKQSIKYILVAVIVLSIQYPFTKEDTQVIHNVELNTSYNNHELVFSSDYDQTMNEDTFTEDFFYDNEDLNSDGVKPIALKAFLVTINNMEYSFFTDLSGSSYVLPGNPYNITNGQNIALYVSTKTDLIAGFSNTSFTFTYEKSFNDKDVINKELQAAYNQFLNNENTSL